MRNYRFSDRVIGANTWSCHFWDRYEALLFLRRMTTDFDTLHDLRIWASKRGTGPRSDRDLMEFAATCLVSGELVVGSLSRLDSGGLVRPVTGADKSGGGVSEQRPRPTETYDPRNESGERTTPSAFRQPRQELLPEVMPVSALAVDVARQVVTLLSAARDGTPFCEQCEQARHEQRR
jgi:hypothetical protein